jgi:3-hydroxyisobutyrate dehydrogenase-like beta-hydroxyacid dehydrogenase
MSKKVAFIGLGVMGYPMAGHLQAAGHQVTVFNRNSDKAQRWQQQYGGSTAPTPAAAAAEAEVVFTCVGNDDDLRAVTLGKDGILQTLRSDAVLVDHTTASAEVARELAAACAQRGAHFVDAPVSGGQQGAENGQLTIMCGGEQDAFDRAREVMDSYARAVTLMGPVGSGQLTKMVKPDLCRRGAAGPRRRNEFCRARRPRPAHGNRRHFTGRRRLLADEQPSRHHDCRRI